MPEIDLKEIKKELSNNIIRSSYWFYGSEQMKINTTLSLIKEKINIKDKGIDNEIFYGDEVSFKEIINSILTPSFLGNKVIVVKNANQIKNIENIINILPKENSESIIIFISKDLDKRVKSSKLILKELAVIPCLKIKENEKISCIKFLSKKRNLTLDSNLMSRLLSLEPWSLDIIDQELEKVFLISSDKYLEEKGNYKENQDISELFFLGDHKNALIEAKKLSKNPETSYIAIGLISWNIRHFISYLENNCELKNYFILNKFKKWSSLWSIEGLKKAESNILSFDISLKTTTKNLLGLWTDFLILSKPS